MLMAFLLACSTVAVPASVVKWISQRSSEPSFQVRVLAEAQTVEVRVIMCEYIAQADMV